MDPGEALRDLRQAVTLVLDLLSRELAKALGSLGQELDAREYTLGDDLRRRAGRRGPHVGHKIADGEVNLMPDRRDDRQCRVEDRAGHHLFVEGPQILQTAAPARDEDKVHGQLPIANCQLGGVELVEQPDGGGDFLRGARALDTARHQDDLQRGVAAFDHVQHVADGRARR